MKSGWQVDGITGEIVHVAAEAVLEVAARMGWRVHRDSLGNVVAFGEAEVCGPVEIGDGLIVTAA